MQLVQYIEKFIEDNPLENENDRCERCSGLGWFIANDSGRDGFPLEKAELIHFCSECSFGADIGYNGEGDKTAIEVARLVFNEFCSDDEIMKRAIDNLKYL